MFLWHSHGELFGLRGGEQQAHREKTGAVPALFQQVERFKKRASVSPAVQALESSPPSP